MKINFLTICLVVLQSSLVFSQEKLITKSATVTFEASVPAFEEVKATNKNVTVVLNSKTGELASLAIVKGFRFKVALMEEHFNENYIESDKFPKAIFRGKLEQFNANNITASSKDYTLNGTMELHGKAVPIKTIAKLSKTANGIKLEANFFVNANDFDISIPSVVKNKVSNKIKLDIAAVLSE
jgi:hypothetical protein